MEEEAEEERAPIKGLTVNHYLRMTRPEFMAKLRQLFPFQVEGVDRRLDQHLELWQKKRMFVPGQSEGDSLYLAWVLNRVPSISVDQKNALLRELREPPHELMAPILETLRLFAWYRANLRDLTAALNGEDTYTEEPLAELMQADRDRLRDFIHTFARLKRNQVDLTDETWVSAPEPARLAAKARRDLHIKSYTDTVNHPWLDETYPNGKKRTRGEKETIVMGLMYNGPQPRTADDERWRLQDKKQCMRDAFDSTTAEHELVRGQWDGHPPCPIIDQGEPNRFGRLEQNKRVDMRPPYVKEEFRRGSPFGVWDPAHVRPPPPPARDEQFQVPPPPLPPREEVPVGQ
jgi:hypothetical protein